MSMILDVDVFLKACEQKPCEENVHLYRGLIAEEYEEFCQASVMRDDVEQLDACTDMIWVILGYCHMKGFDVRGAWKEVADSNLNKIDRKTGTVTRRPEDGKILKPEGWKPPNLKPYV